MEPSDPFLGFSEIPIEAQPRPTFGPPRPPPFIPDAPIHLAKAPAWRASEALVANPAAIDNPVTVAGAAAEMKTFNATWHAPSDPDSVISECRAAMSNIFAACNAMASNELAPIVDETATALALRPDFAGLAPGAFERVRNLIQSNYSKSSRRSIKTAVRSWARHTARLQVSVFRPNVANNPTLLAQEELILMTWLESLVHEQGVQGSTAESYFSMMKGWHAEVMGYAPAHSGVFISRWIPKILRGLRREFPSKLKGREAHSVACFLPFRESYNHLFEDCFKDIFIDPRRSSSGIQLAKDLLASNAIDLEDILHQTVIETMAACLCRVGEAMPTKERMLKLSRADLSFCYTPDGLLQEAKVMIIPLKKSVRDRKFDQKVPIVIPSCAGPFLKCAELLWLMSALIPCKADRLSSTPLFLRVKNLRAGSSNQCTHKWTQDRYQAKLAALGPEWNIENPKLYTMHTPRIVGATTLFFGGCTEAQLKAKGRWSSDIAFIYSRVCPQQERDLIRLMASTDATPFLEKGDGFWDSVAHFEESGEAEYDSDIDAYDELIEGDDCFV